MHPTHLVSHVAVSSICVALLGTNACSPTVASPPSSSPATSEQPAATASSTPAAATTPAATPAPSGEMGLPAASGKPWNNAQSDGNVPTDRGIADYNAIVQNNRDRFRACYDTSLATHPEIKGQVTLRFVLASNGTVKEAAIDKMASDITLAELEQCMVTALKGLSFPPSKRGMESTVRYPFKFNPGGAKKHP